MVLIFFFIFLLLLVNFLASLIIFSMFFGESLLLSFWIIMWFLVFVFLFLVVIFKISFISILNVILICGIFLGVGGIFVRLNFSSKWLFLVIGRFFLKIWMVIVGWLLVVVEKIWDFLVGIIVLRGMSLVMISLIVSIFMVKGLTFNSRRLLVFFFLFNILVCIVVL